MARERHAFLNVFLDNYILVDLLDQRNAPNRVRVSAIRNPDSRSATSAIAIPFR